jgi:endonuclease/exonuclease/phosphatase (EEP) superfamily protein YafD
MKIISWNLLHKAGATLDEIERLVHREQPDLMLLQETTEAINELPARLGGYYARDPLPGRTHGLAAWSPNPFREAPSSLELQPGMLVKRVCQIVVLPEFTVANVHLSHGQLLNRRQLRRIFSILPKHAAVLGDCNLVGPCLVPDVRDVGPRDPTHMMVRYVPLRLDRCFARELVCQETRVLPKGMSDHNPILVRLARA